ncbi:hypothetical protein DFJ58DRAFT_880423 [Suillus subalutaceus]|uniref:uncharacterized protein n=1 Tax=Suillus subalutaceus TaxID=48586 RepID=UPI001B874070|nr:uncharacterized protein DFJ58DRAFT_880423 [Suillus subalutaceus]KAG1827643.1 hypothetical protein DFJ58DRAFT_880423 [Suillus subalutaceus]
MYTDQDSETIHFLLLIKVIALFNADQHDEANLLLKELTTGCPNADTLACRVVQAYLCVELGLKALDGARHDEAAGHFTAAINSGAFSSKFIHEIYEDLVVVPLCWDLESLWQKAHQKHCDALLRAGKLQDAVKSFRYMIHNIDDTTTGNWFEWSNGKLGLSRKNAARPSLPAEMLPSLQAIATGLSTYTRRRSTYLLHPMLSLQIVVRKSWEKAMDGSTSRCAEGAMAFIVSSPMLIHFMAHSVMMKLLAAFQTMLSKLDRTSDAETRKLREQYLGPSEVDCAIRKIIDTQLDNAPMRVLDTTTGLLCDREAQIRTFKSSIEYKELVSSTITHSDFRTKRIKEVVMTYFQYAMLSHRWEGKEPLLQDIQGKVVYKLDPVGGITKLQSFCKTARDLGYRWAWSDTCCIDKSNNVELQNRSTPSSSKSGALANSVWNTRGWTVQEFLAPNIILFYQKDWTLYLDDRTPNHKDSVAIMQELEYATGIDRRAVMAFRPGMRDIREKLQWASTRITTLQEDIAYSLSGVFGVRLRVDYGEKKAERTRAAPAGNPVYQPTSLQYEAPPCKLPSLSEDEIQSSVSSLRGIVAVESASKLYQTLDYLSAPRFAYRRLHLPCIVFPVTEARWRRGRDQDTYSYELKSGGLHDLQITTADKLIPFSPVRPPPAWQTILLVRPWSRRLLELHDPADDTRRAEDQSVPESSSHDSLPAQTEPIYSDSHSRALRLIVRLGQPFSAFLLARQRDGEFKRIASDHDIIAQVKDMTSVDDMMVIRTLEIL